MAKKMELRDKTRFISSTWVSKLTFSLLLFPLSIIGTELIRVPCCNL